MPEMTENSSKETRGRLLAYSAAAGLGAFTAGQSTNAAIVHVDVPDTEVTRFDPAFDIDADGDGYIDVSLINTEAGGFGYGTVQWRGTVDGYGPAGSDPLYPNRGAGYSVTNTNHGNAYYVRSFDPGEVIGPGNAAAQDITPNLSGNYYGLISSYGGYDLHTFWNPSTNYPDAEYAGFRFVDGNGNNYYGWARFQVTVNDVVNENGLPFPDGIVNYRDYQADPNRVVTIFEYAYENTPDTDIIAGDIGTPVLVGDLNADGFVGVDDLNIVLVNWNQNVTPGDLSQGDVTGEGFVGVDDLNQVLVNWNNGTPPTGGVAVPEPTSLAVLAAGGGALAFGRRRRRR